MLNCLPCPTLSFQWNPQRLWPNAFSSFLPSASGHLVTLSCGSVWCTLLPVSRTCEYKKMLHPEPLLYLLLWLLLTDIQHILIFSQVCKSPSLTANCIQRGDPFLKTIQRERHASPWAVHTLASCLIMNILHALFWPINSHKPLSSSINLPIPLWTISRFLLASCILS